MCSSNSGGNMKKYLAIALCALLVAVSCDPGIPTQEEVDANVMLRLEKIPVSMINSMLAEDGINTILFEGTIDVGSDECLTIPEGKTLIGANPETSIIEGSYGITASSYANLVVLKGTLDNVTVRLYTEESFSNWNDPELDGATATRNQLVSMQGGTLKNSVITNGRNGVHIHSNFGNGSVVENNEIYHNRTGIQYQQGNPMPENSVVTISGNHIYENETLGILVQEESNDATSTTVGTVKITGNTITGNWYSNIEIRNKDLAGAEAMFVNVSISGNGFGDDAPADADKEVVTPNTSGSGEHSSNVRYDDYFAGGSTDEPNPTFVANVVNTTIVSAAQ